MIPGENDGDEEFDAMTGWIAESLGPDIPVHFTAFHPDYKMRDKPRTPPETLRRAREIGLANGLRHVYVGNVHDKAGDSTYCHGCGQVVIGRDWYQLSEWRLDAGGCCTSCGTALAGVFDGAPGQWGRKRQPVRLTPGAPRRPRPRPSA